MVVKRGQNLTGLRENNSYAILQRLQKKKCTACELAEELSISTAAVSIIMSELIEGGYVIANAVKRQGKTGRPQTEYSVNPNFGCVAAISLADKSVKIGLADMCGKLFSRANIDDIDEFDSSVFYETVIKLKDLLAKHCENIPLFGIEMAIPGKIEKETGEIIRSYQFNAVLKEDKNYIKNLFQKHFGVPVKLNNDLFLSLIGELEQGGSFDEMNNVLLVHVGVGLGSAMVFNGVPYRGNRGLAGEIGLINVYENGETKPLDTVSSLLSIRKYINTAYGENYTYDEIFGLYSNGEERVVERVCHTAKVLGNVIKDLNEVLDLDGIVINGGGVKFGEKYLEIIRSEVKRSNDVKIAFSCILDDAELIGAARRGVERAIARRFGQ